MPNIYDFIKEPMQAVKMGYRPNYLSCVSAVAHRWGAAASWIVDMIKDIPETEVKDFPILLLKILIQTLVVITLPVTVWFFGWVQYLNVKSYIKSLEALQEERDDE